jgi:hypothetical protein
MSELKNRLYNMEVHPPDEVWNRLSASLDEINADNSIAQKLQALEVDPAHTAWEKIKYELEDSPAYAIGKRKSIAIPFRRLAAAAIFIGLIISAYFLFFNKQNAGDNIVKTDIPKTTEKITSPETKAPDFKKPEVPDDKLATVTQIKPQRAQAGVMLAALKSNNLPSPGRIAPAEPLHSSTGNEPEMTEEIKEKIFKEQIDDLSLIASNDRYVSMVSADGRMVKIPARFLNLAPYLQDKSSANDYLDILFEESTYWKEKFREWRQKLAQSSVTPSVNNFFDIIGLLNSIQDN